MWTNTDINKMAQKGGLSMLLQFRVKNYKSFSEEAVLDLTASPYLRELPQFVVESRDSKVLPLAVIYGANASGKSNFIDAISSMQVIVRRIFEDHEDNPLSASPYIFDLEQLTQPSEFELFLNIKEYEYRYGFKATRTEIVEEWFSYKLFGKRYKNQEEKKIFHRQGLDIELGYDFDTLSELKSIIDKTTTFLGILGRKEVPHAQDVYDWFRYSFCFSVDYLDSKNIKWLTNLAADYIEQEGMEKQFILDFIKKFDPCIEDIRTVPYLDEERVQKKRIVTIHKGNNFDFPLDLESDGTNKLVRILFPIYFSLYCGYAVVIDEFDSRLHPLLLREVTAIYHDKERNHGNGQLIFSTHNPILLDAECLRRDEIWFVEKDDVGRSSLYSLAEFKDEDKKRVRSDLRYMKNYLLGRFGAIPYQQRSK